MEIKRDFDKRFSVWDTWVTDEETGISIAVHIWDDRDIIFDILEKGDTDILIPVSMLYQVLAAANDYWLARNEYELSQL